MASALCAMGAGIAFFFDPSHTATPGSDAYWRVLAQGSGARTAFLACFAGSSLCAMGVVRALRHLLRVPPAGWLDWLAQLGVLGLAVNAISYVRLLGGESRRAAAYIQGDAATQQAIASFSLVLDPQGWLTFGAVGLFLVCTNAVALRSRAWPRVLGALGIAFGTAYCFALLSFVVGRADWVPLAVGAGAIGLGPLWWGGIAWVLWRTPDDHAARVE
ncbi:DUF4386 family protein [Pseudorhodoferax sp.]|uniref:DUF4386 family protein n=1 Tax=Pseudorhodoferax sp. TaxID=1993553 RepID=UPI002DD66F02|nr:DUF4386 family protein [Pseudorhodoferax sp.]